MRSQRVHMVRQIKEESEKHRKWKQEKGQELIRAKQQNARKDKEIDKLKRENKRKD